MQSPIFPAVAIVATLAAPALATDRYYSDCSATSPSGRYRIDAKSPDNAGGRPRPFASNFTYTLTDTTTNKIVWTRAQPMTREKGSSHAYAEEGSPTSLYVTDDGLVVASLSGHSIVIMEPAGGWKRGEVRILDAFPAAHIKDFVSQTTAGPMWQQDSDWFFVTPPAAKDKPAQTLFVVRPYWNHRLVVDTATSKLIELGAYNSAADPADLTNANADTTRILTAVMTEEAARARAAIKAAPAELKNEKDYGAYWRVSAALHTIAFRKLTDTEADVRALERIYFAPHADGPELLRKIRRTLRAIGKAPTAALGVGHPTSPKVITVEQRVANAPSIKAGMTIDEACALLGDTDAELYVDGRAFDFDVDATPPYTLRVFCPRQVKIERTSIITPFAFRHDKDRMAGY